MPVNTLRRYYLRKSQECYARQEEGLAAAFRAKQDAVAGTALPASFPFLTQLAAARYTCREDLAGADVAELTRWSAVATTATGTNVTLSTKDATTVLAALAALP